MMGPAQILREGKTQYPWEREAIDFIKRTLPATRPYHLAALFEMSDGQSARLYEVDALVVGYSALYLVEIKSHPGVIEGDAYEWYWTPEGSARTRYLDNPLRLTNQKAKILKGLLQRGMKQQCPRIEPLVFLSAPDLKTRFKNGGETAVVTRATLERAITRGEYPGSPLASLHFAQRPSIPMPVLNELLTVMRKQPALRERKGETFANAYQLLEVTSDGPGYQERRAKHRDIEGVERIARVYLVPDQVDSARRKQLQTAAQREFRLLFDLREHPSILRAVDYAADAPVGPTVVFDAFEDGQPLDAFIRRHPDLPLGERIALVVQVARALAYCHKKTVVHGSVGPHAVLIRRSTENGALETRLTSFQLGASEATSGTHHWTQLASPEWGIYQAPDLRESPERTFAVDMYGLGALAYFVLTGQPPARDGQDAYARVVREKCLDPRLVKDDLPERIVDLVVSATRLSPAERETDMETWAEVLDLELKALLTPSSEAPVVDPLEATKLTDLGDFRVMNVLGQGATARVLEVERTATNRHYALKVALEPRHDPRLLAEAEELARLRHPRIVEHVESVSIGHRFALVLTLAGSKTLQKSLEEDGIPTLDRAFRYGDDLLSALEHLEEKGVLHRDIKPANLGVGTVGKDRYALTLFDFSLAGAPEDDLALGTTVYRDPYLVHRPRWDAAADRWSAAITLHELLAGSRPHFGGKSALDDDAEIHIAAERFDPHVRLGLTRFFQKALARDPKDRFETAEDMRRAFRDAVDARSLTAETAAPAPPAAELAKIHDETPIAALPLSALAKNALDRAGLERAGDLHALPDNRISALKNVGRLVQREIVKFRREWRAARGDDGKTASTDVFFEAFRGVDHPLVDLVLPAELKALLAAAGLASLSAIATSPRLQLERLAARHQLSLDPLTKLLRSHARSTSEHPRSIEDWTHALVPATNKFRHARALFGLDGPFAGRIDASVKELADAQDITPQAVYIAIGKSRAAWKEHPHFVELAQSVQALLSRAGGALPLSSLARQLLDRLAEAPSAEPQLPHAAALVRIVAECDDTLTLFRLAGASDGGPSGEGRAFVLLDLELATPLKHLGKVADDLADRTPLPGLGECLRSLKDVLVPTDGTIPFGALDDTALLSLATAASSRAVLSARLEIYPRGMPADVALGYAAPMLPAEITPEAAIDLVAKRYPEAARLPPRPELDAYLDRHEFRLHTRSDGVLVFQRRGERSSLHTQNITLGTLASLNPLPAPSGKERPPRSSGARLADEADSELLADFDEAVRLAIELRSFRVLTVSPDKLGAAARVFRQRTGARLLTLDRLLAERMTETARANKVDLGLLHRADRAGHDQPGDWTNIKRLAQRAAASLPADLLPDTEDATPLLLVQPGLFARYDLDAVFLELVERAKRPTTPPAFLLVPLASSQGTIPLIGPHKPIPGLHSGQLLSIPASYAPAKERAAS